MDISDHEIQAALRTDREQAGRERRKLAAAEFTEAADLAEANGMSLGRFSKVHFILVAGESAWNLYPGNQRITVSRGSVCLKLPKPWGLLDAVKAAKGGIAK